MKIVIIGNVSVGKTSFCNRWAHGTFTEKYKATIGVDFVAKDNVQLWDVAGQERFGAVTRTFYRGSHGAMVVLDWSQSDAIEHAKKWVHDLKEKWTAPIPILVVANKSDLPGRVSLEDLDAFCKGDADIIGWMATSAKANTNVNTAMDKIVACIGATEEMCKEHDIVQLEKEEEEDVEDLCCGK